jgi:membrane protein YdbS with pleckstrin-like domain
MPQVLKGNAETYQLQEHLVIFICLAMAAFATVMGVFTKTSFIPWCEMAGQIALALNASFYVLCISQPSLAYHAMCAC